MPLSSVGHIPMGMRPPCVLGLLGLRTTRHVTNSWSRPLLNRVAEEERDDHDRCGAGSECGEREEEPDKRLALAHPFALSTRSTVNGFCPGGSTWNDRPQWPTMTSAGAAWPYVPGAVSDRW